MLRSLNDLEHYGVTASDGEVGDVNDFLIDDERWVVRYLTVQTGGFFRGRRTLISPISFRHADWSTHRFHVALTRQKIENSPSVDVDKPVSRQHEWDYNEYYGYPSYWGYGSAWGMGAYPGLLAVPSRGPIAQSSASEPSGDAHLRSAKEVRGYHIHGSDGEIGHVADYIVDDETWAVRYLVIDTRNWWFGKKVLVSPGWAREVSWEEQKVYVDLTRDAIKSSPEWDASAAINREYEARLYDYYGRPAYWTTAAPDARASSAQPTEHHPE